MKRTWVGTGKHLTWDCQDERRKVGLKNSGKALSKKALLRRIAKKLKEV